MPPFELRKNIGKGKGRAGNGEGGRRGRGLPPPPLSEILNTPLSPVYNLYR